MSPLQQVTWFQHGAIAFVLPMLFAVLTRTGQEGVVITSWLLLLYFVIREERDERYHKKIGDWRSPEIGSGVTPYIDKFGDLLGPIVATLAFTGAWLLY